MTRKTRFLGLRIGKGSDKYLSPKGPYTGNGKTTRNPHDEIIVEERDANGKPIERRKK